MSLARPAEDLSWAVGLRLSLECALLLPVSQTLDETVLRAACQAIPDIWFVMESDDRQRLCVKSCSVLSQRHLPYNCPRLI